LTLILCSHGANADWFDDLKAEGNAQDLYRMLYYMPKGGDLHNHLSGAAFPEWYYDAALAQKVRGYEFYTKVHIENCRDYGGNEFGFMAYYPMFRNIQTSHYEQLSDCEKSEYKKRKRPGWTASGSINRTKAGMSFSRPTGSASLL
jgi:adenosine deaminase CECR1